MDINELFCNPPREYGVYPIIHDGIGDFQNTVSRLDDCGFAGVVGNIAYDERFPVNPKAWQDFEKGCRAFIQRGMKVWIYDEKGYPSGTAGGAVLERHPEYESTGLVCFTYWKTLTGVNRFRADIPSGKLFKAMLVPLTEGEALDITHTVNANNTLWFDIPEGAYRLVVFVQRRLFDATHAAHSYSEPRRYIDLFNPDATKSFLNTTHEKYREILADEFGKGIKAFFTDEPSLIGWNIPEGSYPLLTWSDLLPNAFYQRYGYEIEKALIAVFFEKGEDFIKRRCDFWELTADLLAENFFGEIQKWCHENNIRSSGHLLCEENLLDHIYCYGSYYRSAKRLDYPGIDQLESEPTALMDRNQIPIARLAASIADVYDLGETFTEASDHTSRHNNRQIPIEWLRASVNWHMALGINNITSYYSFDYFTKQQIQELNLYTARLGAILRQGKRHSRAAIIYPEYSMWAAFKPTERSRNQGQSELALRIQSSFARTSWELLNRQIDFDYIDEKELIGGEANSGKIKVINREYECLILPCMNVMSEQGVDSLCRFMDSGGKVIAVEDLPNISRDTGKSEQFYEKLYQYLRPGGNMILVSQGDFWKASNFLPRTIKLVPNSVNSLLTGFEGSLGNSKNEAISANILSHVRSLGNKLIVFLCNMGGSRYQGKLKVNGFNSAQAYDINTGDISSVPIQTNRGALEVDLDLAAYQARIFLFE